LLGQFVASLQRNVAQMSANGLAQLQSLDEKRRDGASFGRRLEALSTIDGYSLATGWY